MVYFVQMNNDKKHVTILLTNVSVFEDPALFHRCLSEVNEERRCDIENKNFAEDRLLSLGGGLLLGQLLMDWNIPSEIVHNAQGKPLVSGHPNVYISLTHTYPYAAAMISDAPCGLDIERRDRDLEAVARRYYNEREKRYAGNDQNRMTDVWCRKECFIKYCAPQDVRQIDTFSIPAGYEYLSLPLQGYSFEILKPKGAYQFREVCFGRK